MLRSVVEELQFEEASCAMHHAAAEGDEETPRPVLTKRVPTGWQQTPCKCSTQCQHSSANESDKTGDRKCDRRRASGSARRAGQEVTEHASRLGREPACWAKCWAAPCRAGWTGTCNPGRQASTQAGRHEGGQATHHCLDQHQQDGQHQQLSGVIQVGAGVAGVHLQCERMVVAGGN
jgi:hypothetical protein